MIVHLVTDRRRLSRGLCFRDVRECVLRQAQYAIGAGIDVLQVREPDLEARELVDLTVEIVRASRGTRTRVVVNDRVDVALAASADGVHLPGHGLPPWLVRQMAPTGFIVGRSVHSAAEASEVLGADYLIAGTVWASASKPPGHPRLEASGLETIVRAASVPVLAIGGVTMGRASEAAAVGAAGIAAIGLFFDDASDSACRAVPLVASMKALRMGFDRSRSDS